MLYGHYDGQHGDLISVNVLLIIATAFMQCFLLIFFNENCVAMFTAESWYCANS